MEIQKAAVAGTLESSDAQVTVEPGAGGVQLELSSSVMNQYPPDPGHGAGDAERLASPTPR